MPKLRALKLAKKQGMLCHWCGFLMIREVDDGCAVAITLDHLRPKDGRFRDAVAAHRICNTNRGHSRTIPYAVHKRVHRALLLMGIPEPSAPIPIAAWVLANGETIEPDCHAEWSAWEI